MQGPDLAALILANYRVQVGNMANGAQQQMWSQHRAGDSSSAAAVTSCSAEQVIQPVFDSLPFTKLWILMPTSYVIHC